MEDNTNNPVYSVGEFSHVIKKLVESNFTYVRIRGEISRPSFPSSGHVYFTLKDMDGTIAAIIWKYTMPRLSIRPEEGMEVICTGKVTTFAGQSKYQIIVENMEVAGEGALLKMLEDRRKKLLAEGLFDQRHKKQIPYLPERIGVITSPSGAVIKDILHRLSDRFPSHVYMWPVAVQGEGSASQIANAIDKFNELTDETIVKKPDLLIVARGGGSLEDLWSFNEEIVVRAVFNSAIPVISAVGHEIDFVLTDFAADHRAETPTAAARHILQGFLDFEQRTQSAAARLLHNMEQELRRLSREKQFLHKRLQGLRPQRILENSAQQLDELSTRMQIAFVNQLRSKQHTLQERFLQLSHNSPAGQLPHLEARFQHAHARLSTAVDHILHQARLKSNFLLDRLSSASLPRTLARGFSVVTDPSGKVVTCASALSRGAVLCNRFVDGEITSRVE